MGSNGDSAKAASSNVDINLSKVIGFYKRQAWAQKVFDRIEEFETDEGNGVILSAALLRSNNDLYFPAFLSIDLKEKGNVVGAYLLTETNDSFELVPLEAVVGEFENEGILPFQYRTIEKLEGDTTQKNWPDFS